MKLIRKIVEKDRSGAITLRPEEPEDFWNVYHLLSEKDQITAKSYRRISKETASGSQESERVEVTVTIEISKVLFEPGAEELRVSGRCIVENPYMKFGSFHTITIALHKNFTLAKAHWDNFALDRVSDATNPEKHADAAAVVMMEGLAHICLITGNMTIQRARVECHIPKKHKSGSAPGHEKALHKFFDMVLQGILRHINFEVVKAVVIASPGFTRTQFNEYMWEEAQRKDLKSLITNKGKFMLVHSSSGHYHSLKEVLGDEAVALKLADTKAAGEVRALESFFDMLKTDSSRAFYGWKPVEAANHRNAIEVLLLSDELVRAANIATRRQYGNLVGAVKDQSGVVHIFSSMHPSGEQLGQLGGIAAILRFPMPDLEDIVDDEQKEPTEEKEQEPQEEDEEAEL